MKVALVDPELDRFMGHLVRAVDDIGIHDISRMNCTDTAIRLLDTLYYDVPDLRVVLGAVRGFIFQEYPHYTTGYLIHCWLETDEVLVDTNPEQVILDGDDGLKVYALNLRAYNKELESDIVRQFVIDITELEDIVHSLAYRSLKMNYVDSVGRLEALLEYFKSDLELETLIAQDRAVLDYTLLPDSLSERLFSNRKDY